MDLTPLIKLIKKEQTLHERMIEAKRAEQRYLATADANGLIKNTETLYDLISQVQQVEEQRQALTSRIAQELGLENETPTLKDLLAAMPPANRAELEQSGNTLRNTVEELRSMNNANQGMLEHSAEMLADEIRSIAESEKESGVYNQKGSKGARPVPRAGLNLRA